MALRWDEAREILERTPHVLAALLSNISPAWAASREHAASWSPVEVLGHLIQGERDDWLPRTRRLLEHGTEIPFEPFVRDAHLEWCRTRSMRDLLDEFATLRAANLREVDALKLDADTLKKQGTHPTLGPVRLEQLLATWTVHDLNHLNQISRALAARYGEDVGPWNQRDFLRILNGD